MPDIPAPKNFSSRVLVDTSIVVRVVFLIFCVSQGATIFEKKHGHYQDFAHDRWFRKIDSNGDGSISREELLTFVPKANDAIFNYLLARRNLTEQFSETESPSDAITYNDFMWFYREASLFEARGLVPPKPPSELYSFPSWPGQQTVMISEESNDVSPHRFWTEYVKEHKAVIIRNAMEGSRGMAHWSDPEYLVSNFGHLEAKIESRLESRGDRQVKKPVATNRATVREIVNSEVDGYIVSVVPQEMAWEVSVPHCVLCGHRERAYLDLSNDFPFLTELEETSLWVSRGTTRSQLHYDKENTMNCLITGKPKDWLLLDSRKYHSVVPWVRGGGYNGTNDLWNKYTDWVGVDVENLDLNLHEYLKKVEFETVTQNPGDCVYLPYSMLHYAGHLTEINEKTLQVAVSYMWLPESQFFESCQQYSLGKPPLPLAVFDTVWFYSGFGSVPQGNHDPRIIAEAILGEGHFNQFAVLPFLPREAGESELNKIVEYLRIAQVLFSTNVSVPLDLWLELAAAIDMNSLGCNEGTSYLARPLEEMNRMLEYMRNWV